MDDNAKKQIESLAKRVDEIESSLNAAKRILNRLNDDYLKVDYTQIEGTVGKYNGINMLGEDGKEYDISPNYAAKSKLVFGDVLKLIEEDGKKLFKQIERVKRERVEGILTKKEGEWYLLTDRGSYRISDAAAEFQKAELNSQASAFLPADNLNAPFATLDNIEAASVIKSKKPVESGGAKKEQSGNLKGIKEKEIDLRKEKKISEKPPLKKDPTTKRAPVKKVPAKVAPAKKEPPKAKPAVKTARSPQRPVQRPAKKSVAEKKVEKPVESTSADSTIIEQDDLV